MAQPESADKRTAAIESLLSRLEDPAPARLAPAPEAQANPQLSHENRLIQVRLGIASSLFTALRAKHSPTADHSLRVAMGCSAWAEATKLPEQVRDELEVAALLHDVGKIGVPDQILLKPASLSTDEMAVVAQHRKHALDILGACTVSRSLLDIVRYSSAWYDGSRGNEAVRGEQLPLGSRMLAIVDAFDSMITDQLYRRALSRERAMSELFACSGTQFDPLLVRDFCALQAADQMRIHTFVLRRWLQQLDAGESNQLWRLQGEFSLSPQATSIDGMFQEKLLEHMHDGVIFVDTQLRILLWNQGLERITGIPRASVIDRNWTPGLIGLRDELGTLIREAECPVAQAIREGVQLTQRVAVRGAEGELVTVDAHVVPVIGPKGTNYGATLMLRDATSETSLQEHVLKLHEKATRDPLTKAANRAEFDRCQAEFVTTYLQRGRPCALIIADIDHFKKINDNYGHQAGDAVLIAFAALMQRNCRKGDLVARYGGEEFVMLCADCDNASATQRAEAIRRQLADIPQAPLNGSYVTASFGVTELQEGDTPETMLRRSDRALYQAKENGRNMVVQLGAGLNGEKPRQVETPGWFSWLFGETPEMLLERKLLTFVPIHIATEKLRGFVADQDAEIESVDVETGLVVIRLDGDSLPLTRRNDDRAVPFRIEMTLREYREPSTERGQGRQGTQINVAIRPQNSRDRRRQDAIARARQLLGSIKSYLMANEIDIALPTEAPAEGDSPTVFQQASSFFSNLTGGAK